MTGPAPAVAPTVAPGPAAPVRHRSAAWWTSGARAVPPIAFGLVVLALWQIVVKAADVPTFVLPAPSDIGRSLVDNAGSILSAALSTGSNALVGLLAGTLLAVLLAALATRLRWADEMITPLAAAAAAVPIVALAPLFNNMLSSVSVIPRRLVVTISVFVPIFMNVLRGLQRLAPVHAELMASYAAKAGDVLRTIRIPTALPFFFTGLRVAASLAVISAVVAEYFGGLQKGLGPRITSAVGASDYAAAWASVVGAIVLGLVFYLGAVALESAVMRGRARP